MQSRALSTALTAHWTGTESRLWDLERQSKGGASSTPLPGGQWAHTADVPGHGARRRREDARGRVGALLLPSAQDEEYWAALLRSVSSQTRGHQHPLARTTQRSGGQATQQLSQLAADADQRQPVSYTPAGRTCG